MPHARRRTAPVRRQRKRVRTRRLRLATTRKDPDAELKTSAIDLVTNAGVDLDDVLDAADLERIARCSRDGASARRRAVIDAAPGAVTRIARHVKRNAKRTTLAAAVPLAPRSRQEREEGRRLGTGPRLPADRRRSGVDQLFGGRRLRCLSRRICRKHPNARAAFTGGARKRLRGTMTSDPLTGASASTSLATRRCAGLARPGARRRGSAPSWSSSRTSKSSTSQRIS